MAQRFVIPLVETARAETGAVLGVSDRRVYPHLSTISNAIMYDCRPTYACGKQLRYRTQRMRNLDIYFVTASSPAGIELGIAIAEAAQHPFEQICFVIGRIVAGLCAVKVGRIKQARDPPRLRPVVTRDL